MDYFDNAPYIKSVVIDDDETCELHGRLDGYVGSCPRIAWKRMHCGIYKGLQMIPDELYDRVLNIRMDIMSVGDFNQDSPIKWSVGSIIDFVNNDKDNSIFKFMTRQECIGIDNCYIGTVHHMKLLCEVLHKKLDSIDWMLYNSLNQERLVHRVAQFIIV